MSLVTARVLFQIAQPVSPVRAAARWVAPNPPTHLNWLDVLVIGLYFVAVLAVGLLLKTETRTSDDFFLAGREMTAWVAGISFLAANMGALELLGWAAAAYQYGLLAAYWHWIGAVPAMLILGLVMMLFYYISKTHSVPGYLKLRFGEPTRGALRTQLCRHDSPDERHRHVRHGQGDAGSAGLEPELLHTYLVGNVRDLCHTGRFPFSNFERGTAVLPDLGRGAGGAELGDGGDGRLGRLEGAHPSQHGRQCRLSPAVVDTGTLQRQLDGSALDRDRPGAWLCGRPLATGRRTSWWRGAFLQRAT